jgi:hypothetical protein
MFLVKHAKKNKGQGVQSLVLFCLATAVIAYLKPQRFVTEKIEAHQDGGETILDHP